MWFKQASLFEINDKMKSAQDLNALLQPLSFTPCLPSLPLSVGWVSPIGDNRDQLVHAANGYWMLCFQFEEKILPAGVVNDAVNEKVKLLEQKENRPVRSKEKQAMKEDVFQTLLPKAFTKKSTVYGYIDVKRNLLIVDSSTPAKVERFTAFLKRAITPNVISPMDVKKPSHFMTRWIKDASLPRDFVLGQSAVMQDPQQFKRVIRAQQQNLMSQGIQTILQEGCEVTQLSMSWKEQVQFTLTQEFSIKSIKFQDAVIELTKADYTETNEQRFDTDFVIMTDVLGNLIDALLSIFKIEVDVFIEETVAA